MGDEINTRTHARTNHKNKTKYEQQTNDKRFSECVVMWTWTILMMIY